MGVCLVVDDDESSRIIATDIAEGCGFTVEEAINGLHALEMCKQKMPDVIILDCMMPEMGGTVFLSELKKLDGGDGPKVVMCSAKFGENDINSGFDAGAYEYLRKPMRQRDMVSVLNTIKERFGQEGSGFEPVGQES